MLENAESPAAQAHPFGKRAGGHLCYAGKRFFIETPLAAIHNVKLALMRMRNAVQRHKERDHVAYGCCNSRADHAQLGGSRNFR